MVFSWRCQTTELFKSIAGKTLLGMCLKLNKMLNRKKMKRSLQILVFGALLIGLTTASSAQGILKGRVIDTQNLSMPGANIVLKGTNIGAVTNHSGDFAIIDLPAGSYQVDISYLGYGSTSHSRVIRDNETTTLNLKLDERTIESLE